ncbi:hypothetical protein R6Z07F_007382 [Ovis aries]
MEPLATQKPGRPESGPVTIAQQAPRETGSEFELRHQQTVSDLTSQLHTTPGTAYQSFEQKRWRGDQRVTDPRRCSHFWVALGAAAETGAAGSHQAAQWESVLAQWSFQQ